MGGGVPLHLAGGGEDAGAVDDAEGFALALGPFGIGAGEEDFLASVNFERKAADGVEAFLGAIDKAARSPLEFAGDPGPAVDDALVAGFEGAIHFHERAAAGDFT